MPLQRKLKLRTNGDVSFAFFICKTYNLKKKDICSGHRIRADVLEKAVLVVINKYIDMAVEMNDLILKINKSSLKKIETSRTKKAINDRECEIKKIESIMLDLYPDYKSNIISKEQYLSLKVKYEAEYEKTKAILRELNKNHAIEMEGVDGTNGFVNNFSKIQVAKNLSRELLISLVDSIIVHEGGGIEIKFKFQDEYYRAANYIETNRDLVLNHATQMVNYIGSNSSINAKEAL